MSLTDNTFSSKSNKIESLYALKALCAFFVVIIHTPLVGKDLYREILDVAVPCFFMITGFFLYSGEKNKERSKAKKWLIKIITLDIFLTLIYLITGIIEGKNFLYPTVILKTFLIGDIICVHLWYLTALWQALLIFILLRKQDKLFYFCLLFFLFNPTIIFFSEYAGITNIPEYFTRNCFGIALPFLCTGYLISKYKNKLKSSIYYFLGAIVCFTSIKFINIYYLEIILSILVFIAAYKYDYHIPKFISSLGKEHSANIYYYHMIVYSFLTYSLKEIFFYNECGAILVFILSFFFSIFVNKMQAIYYKDRSKGQQIKRQPESK